MSPAEPSPPPWIWLRPILRLVPRIGLARLAILASHLVLIGGGYVAVLRLVEARGVSMFDSSTWVDDWIPATPWAFWIYATLYLYFPVTIAMAPRTRRGVQALLLHLQAQLGLSAITWVMFLALPTRIHIREQMQPALQASGPVLQGAFEILYTIDAPWNAWPSLHVSLSLLMGLACMHFTLSGGERHSFWPRGRADHVAIVAGVLGWLALCWSILATKQHFFFDVCSGSLAGLATWLVYLRPRLRTLDGEPRGATGGTAPPE